MLEETNDYECWIGEAEPSWQSQFIVLLMRFFRIKQRKASVKAVKKRLERLKSNPVSYTPTGLGRGINIKLKNSKGWPIYYTVPSSNPNNGNYIIFIHGGGYIDEIVKGHWQIIGELTRRSKNCCIVPIYRLAPKATAKEVVPLMAEIIGEVLENAGSAKVCIVGNSAGAGLALAAAQFLRDNGCKQPEKLILISPALNASQIRPEQYSIEKEDPLLDIEGALEGARLYAGDLNLSHPFISPLNGSFRGLPSMLIFSGTLDFLYPDSIDLAKKAKAAGVYAELYLKKAQPHNYPAMPTPEGREALDIIIKAVQ